MSMQAYLGEIDETIIEDEKYLMINFSGCDFRCPNCNTPELIENNLEQQTDLREIKKLFSAEFKGILVTGGEPCFQKASLVELLKAAKQNNYHIILDTNGSKPEVIEYLLKNELVNRINIDFKSPLTEHHDKVTRSSTFFKQNSEIIKDYQETIHILKSYDEKVDIVFETLIVPGLLYRKEDLVQIANSIEGINCRWKLKAFKPGITKDKRLSNLNSPTIEFLQNLANTIMNEYKIQVII